MTDWVFVLTPLLVLPIVLLFRFVGCGLTLVGEAQPAPATPPVDPPSSNLPPPSNPTTQTPPVDPPPKYPPYREYILGQDSKTGQVKHPSVPPDGNAVIAYWRLVDPPAAESVPGGAVDEKGFQAGTYQKGYALPVTADSKGIPAAAITSGPPGLIVTDTKVAASRLFGGGHVKVDFKAGLYTDNFTIEAWILATAFDPGYEYVLFDARARYAIAGMGTATRGFRVFVDQQGGWQVQLAPSNVNLFPSTPIVPVMAPTHVAVTVSGPAGGSKSVNLYVGGKPVTTVPGAVVVPATVTTYNRPDNLPLLIGVENVEDNQTQTPQYRHAVQCRIQEVVLYNRALTLQEIENHVFINQP